MQKDFDSWNALKQKLDSLDHLPFFHEKEVWWSSVGINIGSEIYGKGATFSRPVLILRKFSKRSFLGIPLTTKIKDNFGYHKFLFHGKEIYAVISDIKKMDSKRLGDKIGELPSNKFGEIKKEVAKMIFSPQ